MAPRKPLYKAAPKSADNGLMDWQPAVYETPAPQWMLTFIDLLGIMVAMFVLIFSTKELNRQAWGSMRDSMGDAFTMGVVQEAETTKAEDPEAEMLVTRKGSVLPYLEQVLEQKLAEAPSWDKWQGRYDAGRDELWYPWRSEGDMAALASVLQTWKNQVALVAGSPKNVPDALAAADDLRARGALVLREVEVRPGLADGVWFVVKGVQ